MCSSCEVLPGYYQVTPLTASQHRHHVHHQHHHKKQEQVVNAISTGVPKAPSLPCSCVARAASRVLVPKLSHEQNNSHSSPQASPTLNKSWQLPPRKEYPARAVASVQKMVKFGRHVLASKDTLVKVGLHVVDYQLLKPLSLGQHNVPNFEQFVQEWEKELTAACADFSQKVEELWRDVWECVLMNPSSPSRSSTRGVKPTRALELYVDAKGIDASHRLVETMKLIRSAAALNTEALRKAFKKYDKHFTHEQNSTCEEENDDEDSASDVSAVLTPAHSPTSDHRPSISRQSMKGAQYDVSRMLVPRLYAATIAQADESLAHYIETLRVYIKTTRKQRINKVKHAYGSLENLDTHLNGIKLLAAVKSPRVTSAVTMSETTVVQAMEPTSARNDTAVNVNKRVTEEVGYFRQVNIGGTASGSSSGWDVGAHTSGAEGGVDATSEEDDFAHNLVVLRKTPTGFVEYTGTTEEEDDETDEDIVDNIIDSKQEELRVPAAMKVTKDIDVPSITKAGSCANGAVANIDAHANDKVGKVDAGLLLHRSISLPVGTKATASYTSTTDHAALKANATVETPASADKENIVRRQYQLRWLRAIVKTLPSQLVRTMVAHRGFHNVTDHNDRPIENSLAAYEAAWTSGVRYCECDVTLTRDEHIVLCHDETFERLALLQDGMAGKKVSELTLREIISLPLKCGARPPLLLDVLNSALRIGGDAQLIIEIKPGTPVVADALKTLFEDAPVLLQSVAVIMSFDLYIIHHMLDIMRDVPHRPKIMLLTSRNNDVNCPIELQVRIKDDLSRLHKWLSRDNASKQLDGVYMQYEDDMLTGQGADALGELCKQYTVGVWGSARQGDPDKQLISEQLMSRGVSFVNTDLPTSFSTHES